MEKEDKELLLKDILGRLPYGLVVKCQGKRGTLGYNLYLEEGDMAFGHCPMKTWQDSIETVKPYLRPMSDMTDSERDELYRLTHEGSEDWTFSHNAYVAIDWLNGHHFDYRGLIGRELALKAPDGMYGKM